MIGTIRRILTWIQKYERQLSAPVFIIGFFNDVFLTYGRLQLSDAILVLGSYIVIAAFATIASHYLYVRRGTEGWKLRSARTLLSLLAQFVTGGLLSGCLIFYTRDAALSASWPFLVAVALVFVGDEFFRHYREALIFRTILFFFTTYIYVLFAYPSLVQALGPMVFLQSTGIVVGVFDLYLLGLALAGWQRLRAAMIPITGSIVGITVLMVTFYFTGVIPPLPLALVDAQVYHTITRTQTSYLLRGEAYTPAWWQLGPFMPAQIIHEVPGQSLSVYSSIFAPTDFSTGIAHRWQQYDVVRHRWNTVADIQFSINGGRDGGYRGYTTLSSLTSGKWRVSIETTSGQVIGRTYFTVLTATTTPDLISTQK